MKNLIVCAVFLAFLLTKVQAAASQMNLAYHLDLAQNNVSQGNYLSMALRTDYSLADYSLEAGAQFQFIHPSNRIFSAAKLALSRSFSLGEQHFLLEAFGLYRNTSKRMYTTDWALLLHYELRHIDLALGSSFKNYRVREKALAYPVAGTVLRENFNLIYCVSYFINSPEKPWNIGLSLTNLDHFLVNQETNPMLNLRAEYRLNPIWKLYMENWYQAAGSLNLSAHYFGFFVRCGFIWTPTFGN